MPLTPWRHLLSLHAPPAPIPPADLRRTAGHAADPHGIGGSELQHPRPTAVSTGTGALMQGIIGMVLMIIGLVLFIIRIVRPSPTRTV
jgi:hypothetical protein